MSISEDALEQFALTKLELKKLSSFIPCQNVNLKSVSLAFT